MTKRKGLLQEVKLSFQLWRFAINFKLQMTMCGIFFALCVLLIVLAARPGHTGNDIAGVYSALLSMYCIQLLFTTSFSSFIQSTSYKRALQTKLVVLQYAIMQSAFYTVLLVLLLCLYAAGLYDGTKVMDYMTSMMLLTLVIPWMMPMMYKLPLPVYIGCLIAAVPSIMILLNVTFGQYALVNIFNVIDTIPVFPGVLLMYAVIAFDSLLMYVVSSVFYRRPAQEWLINQNFRQAK